MFKYIMRRFWLVKVFIGFSVSLLLAFSSIWLLDYATIDFQRSEKAIEIANNFTEDTIFVEAPALRTDVSYDLLPVFKSSYFKSEQIDQLLGLGYISEVVPLVGTTGDMESFDISTFVTDLTILDEKTLTLFQPVPSAYLPDNYSRYQLVEGSYPKDETNQIALSSFFKGVNLGDEVTIDNQEYIVSGIINSNSAIAYFPYNDGAYEQMYYPQTIDAINANTLSNTIDYNEVIYGDLFITFTSTPTKDELDEVSKILDDGAIYYQGYRETFKFKWMYIKMSLLKNKLLLSFTLYTCVILWIIYKFIMLKENRKLVFYQFDNRLISRLKKIEFGQLIIIYTLGLVFIFAALYREMRILYFVNFIIIAYLLFFIAYLSSIILMSIFSLIRGAND